MESVDDKSTTSMKKIRLIVMVLLAFAGLAWAQEDNPFDFDKYRASIDQEAYYQCVWDDALNYVDYALIDIDEDGKSELWVRSEEEQSWQGVFAIDGDSVVFLAYADRCCSIVFFKNAVGYRSYVSPGRAEERYCVLNDSRIVASAFKSQEFDIFSEDMETEYKSFMVNDEDAEEADFDRFVQQLGEPVEMEPVWHKIK